MVNIFEGLFILALDEEEGDIVESVGSTLESTLAGSILIELVLQNRVELRDNRVVVTDQTPTEHPILDKALFDILDTARTRKLKYWINTLTYNKLPKDIGHHLVEKGVLVRKKKRLRLAYSSVQGPVGNVSAKYSLKNRLRDIVLAEQQPELPEKVLLAFLYRGDLLKLVFKHGERKLAHKHIKKLISGDEKESGLGEIIDQIVTEACQDNG